jgi:hypothetical protein
MKAEYICADQPVTLIFRLRQSGGPYIPVSPSSGRNRQGSDDFRLHHYGRFLVQCLTQQCSTGYRLRVS